MDFPLWLFLLAVLWLFLHRKVGAAVPSWAFGHQGSNDFIYGTLNFLLIEPPR